MKTTIDALVEALEAEKEMRLYGKSPECGKEQESLLERRRAVYKATDAALAQARAEQAEPCGYLYDWTHSSATGKPDEQFTGFAKTEELARWHTSHVNIRPVYTTPPAAPVAKLEPLSDAEIDEEFFYSDSPKISPIQRARIFARAIEAAHNAKLSK